MDDIDDDDIEYHEVPHHRERECPTKTPEPHILGEFPMTCYQCHMFADS